METARLAEVCTAVLGASAALAGILLVPIGLLFARADSFRIDEAPDAIVQKFRRAAAIGLVPVLVCATAMMAGYEWLLCTSSRTLYVLWRWGFWAEVVAFAAYAIVSVRILSRNE